MRSRSLFAPHRTKMILSDGKRADHWPWTRCGAYPYKRRQHRCEFCYCRERKYCPFDDADLRVRDDFAYATQVQ
jgi:hypothetical protein